MALALSLSCSLAQADESHRPLPGSNQVLMALPTSAEGVEVIVSDVVLPLHTQVPPHSHPGEGFVCILEGSAMHVEEGQEDRIYRAGEAFIIKPRKVHAPYSLGETTRAIVCRVHIEGQPIRIPAE